MNTIGSYFCLPSIDSISAPIILTNRSGGDSLQVNLTLEPGTAFTGSLGAPINGLFSLYNISYGVFESFLFGANVMHVDYVPSTGALSYNLNTGPGYGSNLSVAIPWSVEPGVEMSTGYPSTGWLVSLPSFGYPAPVLTNRTLRFNVSSNVTLSPDGSYATVTMPGTGLSQWLTFEGIFGDFPNEVSVSYSSDNDTFACVTTPDPYVLNGPSGSITDTSIVCRTATNEPAGDYRFTVHIGNQVSQLGVDVLIFPEVPIITSISGCPLESGAGTFDCGTSGGFRITITGRNYGPTMEADVAEVRKQIKEYEAEIVRQDKLYIFYTYLTLDTPEFDPK